MRYWNELYRASDVDILKYVAKKDKNHDFKHDPMIPTGRSSAPNVPHGGQHGIVDPKEGLPMQSFAKEGGRVTDMSTGLAPVSSRGFNFVSL